MRVSISNPLARWLRGQIRPLKAFVLAVLGLAGFAGAQTVIKNQGYLPFADAPIHYRSENLNDPIAKLQKQLDGGEIALEYESGHGYLRSVLRALQVSVSSQTLVFSKTSVPEDLPGAPARTLLQ